jgi:DNA replicative helicase MCM subunit Mcm2 (Cdc46/Mcm family)
MKRLLLLLTLSSVLSCSHSMKRQLASGFEEEKKEGFYELIKPNIKRSYLNYSEKNLMCRLHYDFIKINEESNIKYSEIEDLNYDDMVKVRGLIEKYSKLFYQADQAVTEERFDFKGEMGKEEGDLELFYFDDQVRESWGVLNIWQLSEVSDSGFKGNKLEIVSSKFVPTDVLEQERSFLMSICLKAKNL